MKEIINKLTHGMYVLTTKNGGCIVDAACQISSSDNPFISVSIMKSNNTSKLLKENDTFILSVLGENVDPQLIDNFGFHSSKDYDKFKDIDTIEIEGIKVPEDIIGYIVIKKEDMIDVDTHNLFIGKAISGKLLNNRKELTYNNYKEHKDKYIKVKTENNKTAWVCTVCGYVYYGEKLPKDFKCPICGVGIDKFIKKV